MTARRKVKAAILALMKPGQHYTTAGLSKQFSSTRETIGQAMRRMQRDGKVFVLVYGRDRVYFSTAEGAAQFSAEAAAAFEEQQAKVRAAAAARACAANVAKAARRYAVAPAKPGRPAPVVIAPRPAAPKEIDMTKAVWTIAKPPVDRFAVDPASIKPGAFAIDMPAGRWSDYAVRRAA